MAALPPQRLKVKIRPAEEGQQLFLGTDLLKKPMAPHMGRSASRMNLRISRRLPKGQGTGAEHSLLWSV